ncbi:hypothetical protein [Pararcticibacter amylolyticus]|nr:hypothetical protein [Pararcticibacter amylolyticus]
MDIEAFFSIKRWYVNLAITAFIESWSYLFALGLFVVIFDRLKGFIFLKIVYLIAIAFLFAWLFDFNRWVFSWPEITEKIPAVLSYTLTGTALLISYELSVFSRAKV